MFKIKSTKIVIWMLAIIFAVLATIPFIVPHCGPLALFSFVPLFLMEDYLAVNGTRHKFLYFYAAFLLFNIGATFWVWCVSPVGAVAALGLNALQMALIFSIFSYTKRYISRKWLAYCSFAILWIAWEHIYFNIEISWPWLVLGNSFATSPYLVQWYEITGSLGGSLWIIADSIILYDFIKNRKRVYLYIGLCLTVIPIAFSLSRFFSYNETDDPVEVLAIQPNIDPFMKYGITPQDAIDKRFVELAQANVSDKTKFVISPETFTYGINLDNPVVNSSYQTYMGFLEANPEVTMILGTMTEKIYYSSSEATNSARKANKIWYDLFNTAMTIDSNGINDFYHKSKLVPGVEIIPYQNTLKFLGPIMEKFGGTGSSYGTMSEMKPIKSTDGTNVGAMICYESVYGEYSRLAAKKSADFLTVITNDGWWGDTPGYRQHFRYAGLRAIEMRRDVVQVANTGISGFIDQRGIVKSRTGWWEETALLDTVNKNSEITFFSQHGDLIGLLACYLSLLAAGLFIYATIEKRKVTKTSTKDKK